MKKSILIFFVMSICNFANAQISVYSLTMPQAHITSEPNTSIDAIFMFNGINLSTEIICDYTNTEGITRLIEWRRYDDYIVQDISANTQFISLSFSPENNNGYILYVDNVPEYWLWVFDYSFYSVNINDLRIAPIEQDFCKTLTLIADIIAPDLVYYDKNNQPRTLARTFMLDYVDYAFNGENWQDDSVASKIVNYHYAITIPAPKQDVTFILSGDSLAKQLGVETSFSFDYQAVAVESHLKGTIQKRGTDPANEQDRDNSNTNQIEGSAPLEVDFESRANTPVAAHFEWIIYEEKTPLRFHRYSDKDIRYTFPEDGTYCVKLTVTDATGRCTFVDSVYVHTMSSLLEVPNFFTPNNDDVNDEFRVAYRSIKSYKCVVFNRWGSVVFTSTDPNKGWDGKIRGKPAAEGTYYYVITARGTDIDTKEGKNNGKLTKHDRHGAVNLFR